MTKIIASFLFFVIIFTVAAQQKALTVTDVVDLVLQKETSVLQSEETLTASLNDYRSLLANKYPQLNLASSYGLDYTSKRQDLYYLGDFERYKLHSVSLGFTLDQLVPTYGTLSFGVSYELTSRLGSVDSEELDPFYSHNPALSLSFSQPVLLNGKFIDMGLYRASFRKGQIGYQSAAQGSRISKNQAISSALTSMFDIVSLQNEIVKIKKAIALKEMGLENLQHKFEQGLVAETEVWEMRVEIGNEKELLLANVYSLREKEGDLRLSLGLLEDQEINIAEELFVPQLRLDNIKSPDEIFRDNPTIRQYELSAEEASLDSVIDGANDASIWTLSIALAPRYPYARLFDADSTFGEAITDYFDPKAGFDLGFMTELKIPLYNGSKWRHKVKADKATEASRREELAHRRRDLLLSLRMLLLMQENLKEKIPLLEDNIRLRKKQAEVERELLKIGQTTELDVIKLEIEYLEKQNDLTKAKMDLYLTVLETLSLMGANLEEVILER